MEFQITISGFVAVYIFMLAAFAGWVIIGRVPAILHTPLMSGSNFVHGIVVVGGIYALLNASTVQEQVIGFVAVLLGAGNAAGGYAVTDRMLAMFKTSAPCNPPIEARRKSVHANKAIEDADMLTLAPATFSSARPISLRPSSSCTACSACRRR